MVMAPSLVASSKSVLSIEISSYNGGLERSLQMTESTIDLMQQMRSAGAAYNGLVES